MCLAHGASCRPLVHVLFDCHFSNVQGHASRRKGIRVISDAVGEVPGKLLTLMGTDDGETFWQLKGAKGTNGDLVLDFSPKGGPAGLAASWRLTTAGGKISFSDGNDWLRVDASFAPNGPDFTPRVIPEAGPPGIIQGIFADAAHWDKTKQSFAGLRFISDSVGVMPGRTLTIIGTDDGVSFWTLAGTKGNDVTLNLDFSPKGGPANLMTEWDAAKGRLIFSDGNYWTRVAQSNWRSASGHI